MTDFLSQQAHVYCYNHQQKSSREEFMIIYCPSYSFQGRNKWQYKEMAPKKKKNTTHSTYTVCVCLDKERQRRWSLACVTFITSLTLICSELGSDSTFICYPKLVRKPQPSQEYTWLHHKPTSNLLAKESNGNFKNLQRNEFSYLPSSLQNR